MSFYTVFKTPAISFDPGLPLNHAPLAAVEVAWMFRTGYRLKS
jgi:hypothetical protein